MSNFTVRFHRLAAKEYRLAFKWYFLRSANAARRFRAEVKRVIQRIAESPDLGAVYRGKYRWMRLHRFRDRPEIIYQLTESSRA